MKQCNKCKGTFDESNFYKDKSKKDGLSTLCIPCRKQWKINNKERISEYNHKYGQDTKAWAAIRQNRSRNARIEHYRELRRQWAVNNPERNKEHKDADYKKHRDKYVQRAKLRRVREKGILADFTLAQWNYVLNWFGHECAYCGGQTKLQQEHIIPVVKYGEYTMGNIVPACKRCNQSKHHIDLLEWYPKQVFYSVERLNKIALFVSEHANQSGRLSVTV